MTKPASTKKTGSPPFVTGGGGFDYEDRVAAYILAAMLAEQPPFGEGTRGVSRADWQTGTSGWQFDDLLMTCEDATTRRIAVSCKKGRHVTAGGWPKSTVACIWNQWLSTDNNPFQRQSDLLALVSGSVSQNAQDAWRTLLGDALVGDASRFMQQYQAADSSSKAGRKLVASLQCPPDQTGLVADELAERFQVIRRVRLWALDALADDSAAITRAIEWCRSALASGDRTEADELFQMLVWLASERRPRSGAIVRRELIALVAARFDLKVAPSHKSSWHKIDRHSAELQDDVRTTIDDNISFTQTEVWSAILEAATPGRVVLLEGESGSGKSALAKRLALGRRRALWLSASDLEHTTITAVGERLSSTFPLDGLIDEERSTDALLVIDGAERLTATGRKAAAKLIAAAVKATNPWLTVIATQRGGTDALLQDIQTLSPNVEPLHALEVRLPGEDAIQEAVSALGVALSKKATPSLLRALRNLKALDWVARAAKRTALKSFPDLVEQVWSGFIGPDNARARSEILKTLGKHDAALVVGGVPNSVLSGSTEQQVTETLIRDGLLVARRERLFFRHDLIGDWARLLVLIESGEEAAQALEDVSGALRWEPALRLFAEWLLQEGDEERQRLVSLIIDDPMGPSSLALLQGLFRSPECGPALVAILDSPSSKTPKMLERLLSTFVSVTTAPARMGQIVDKTHPESASIREAFRTPIHELWPTVIEVMAPRAQELAELVPSRLGTVMRRWLSDWPTVTQKDFVETHRRCSTLAVAAARELQARIAESRRSFRNEAQYAFEAALYSAPWLPDEVAAVALELAARRPEPDSVKERVEAEKRRVSQEIRERLAKMTPDERRKRKQGTLSVGPMPRPQRPALPDGPADSVNEEFREAIFASGVLTRLMYMRPAEAHEVLLACCLEDPGAEDSLYSDFPIGGQTGTVDPMGWYPPLYLRGPWLALLGQVPKQGLEAIMRLVAVGTAEWLRLNVPPSGHSKHDWHVRITTISLRIDGVERDFRGDHSVFGWYRGYGRAGNIVPSALMALESWLYGQVDNSQSIDWIVNHILESGTSVALLGVLAALARRHPDLLEGRLRPLIQSWMLLDWDEDVTGQAHIPPIDPFGLRALNTAFDNEAERWSALPHRTVSLPRLIAQQLAFEQPDVIRDCATARESWQAEINDGTCLSTETVERLIALLDPKNLSLTQRADGQLILSVQWPLELQARYDDKGKTANAGIIGFQLRQTVRQLLDAPHALTDEQADLIWQYAASLPDPEPGDSEHAITIVDARAAAAAALENHAGAWLDEYPDRRAWCESAAVAANRDWTSQQGPAGGLSLFAEHGEAFAGTWGVARLAAGDDRELVRHTVAEAMTAHEHIVTGQVLAAAIRLAAHMPGELERLFNLTWLWAALRRLSSGIYEPESREARTAAIRRQRLINAYVQKRIPSVAVPWDDLKVRAARLIARHERRGDARRPSWGMVQRPASPSPLPSTWDEFHSHGFNWNVLEKVAEKTPFVVRPSLGPGLAPLIEFDRRLLDLAVWNMKRAPKRRRATENSWPNTLDQQTLSRAASIIADHEDEDVALEIWKTLAPRLVVHEHWVEAFFESWFSCNRNAPEKLGQFHNRWRLMIAHTDSLPEWQSTEGRRWYDLRAAKSALLGVHERGSKLGTVEDRPFLAKMVVRYETVGKGVRR